MMAVMTSWMPKRALRKPVMAPMAAPPAMPARITTGTCSTMGRSSVEPTSTAHTAPATYWPSAPMLNMPVLKANATEIPVRMMGEALMMVLEMYLGLENTPSNSAAKDATGS
ncbi:Uncharacterised protein [Collinsella intestinalis]|nr:Uncharacterised protein [Collinsella intestinalis]